MSGAGGPSWDGGPGVGATVMEEPLPLRGSLTSQLHWKRTPPLQTQILPYDASSESSSVGEKDEEWEGVPRRKPPSFPNPLCALVLPLVRRAPAKTGDALSPHPFFPTFMAFMTGIPPWATGPEEVPLEPQPCSDGSP